MKTAELNKKYKNKHIGPHRIVEFRAVEDKTCMGKPKVRVIYDGGGEWVYPVKALESIVTDDVSTASALQNNRLTPVVAEVLTVLLEADLTINDALRIEGAVMRKVMMSLDDAVARAFSKLLDREIYFNTAGGDVTLMDLDDMLTGKLVAGRTKKLKNKKQKS